MFIFSKLTNFSEVTATLQRESGLNQNIVLKRQISFLQLTIFNVCVSCMQMTESAGSFASDQSAGFVSTIPSEQMYKQKHKFVRILMDTNTNGQKHWYQPRNLKIPTKLGISSSR